LQEQSLTTVPRLRRGHVLLVGMRGSGQDGQLHISLLTDLHRYWVEKSSF